MTTTQATNHDEINAVNLADEHAEEAVTSLGLAKATHAPEGMQAIAAALCAIADGILATRAEIGALRETLNRELPDIGSAIADAGQD